MDIAIVGDRIVRFGTGLRADHAKRVIDLSDKQSKLWGMISTEDAILLVAVAEAGT